ncbi:MAG: hypothetical protein M3Q45_09185 [Chloroflexota bacterium]|nr:hypothetical protein [Chloroflexota bacterium]
MVKEVLVNEPADTLVRLSANGEIRPTSFLWRNQTRYVSDLGRHWEERIAGKVVRCFLLQTVDNDTFELHYDAAENSWTVHRAWLRSKMV